MRSVFPFFILHSPPLLSTYSTEVPTSVFS
jgi:hypothetical protein